MAQEAELSDAVLFFDECEAVFSQRGTMLNTLLTSIERFHGLVFLATNKPLDIDEAMHRYGICRIKVQCHKVNVVQAHQQGVHVSPPQLPAALAALEFVPQRRITIQRRH